jgi:hypothetical protein
MVDGLAFFSRTIPLPNGATWACEKGKARRRPGSGETPRAAGWYASVRFFVAQAPWLAESCSSFGNEGLFVPLTGSLSPYE